MSTLIEKENNKREFYRISLAHKLRCQITILKIQDTPIHKVVGSVPIKDISAGGILFNTSLELPVNKGIEFSFEFRIFNTNYCPTGVIIRSNEENGYFQYGVKFLHSRKAQEKLLSDLHLLSIYNKKGIRVDKTCDYFLTV